MCARSAEDSGSQREIGESGMNTSVDIQRGSTCSWSCGASAATIGILAIMGADACASTHKPSGLNARRIDRVVPEVEVPIGPPPARVEFVPARPHSKAVWIDGEWEGFVDGRWAWRPGRWVIPLRDATFHRWTLRRDSDGRLWFAPSYWLGKLGVANSPDPLDVAALREPAP